MLIGKNLFYLTDVLKCIFSGSNLEVHLCSEMYFDFCFMVAD